MIRIAVVAAAVLLATAAQAATYAPYELSKAEMKAIEQHIADAMPDPGSAQFRGVVAVHKGAEIVVCGFFNGKNQLGGYAGFTPFVGTLKASGFEIGNYGGSNSENTAVAHVCRGYGIEL